MGSRQAVAGWAYISAHPGSGFRNTAGARAGANRHTGIPDLIPTMVSGPRPVRRGRLCLGGLWPSTRRSAHRSASTGRRPQARAGSASPAFHPKVPRTRPSLPVLFLAQSSARLAVPTPSSRPELPRVCFATDHSSSPNSPLTRSRALARFEMACLVLASRVVSGQQLALPQPAPWLWLPLPR